MHWFRVELRVNAPRFHSGPLFSDLDLLAGIQGILKQLACASHVYWTNVQLTPLIGSVAGWKMLRAQIFQRIHRKAGRRAPCWAPQHKSRPALIGDRERFGITV
jgi:hypothetical protein